MEAVLQGRQERWQDVEASLPTEDEARRQIQQEELQDAQIASFAGLRAEAIGRDCGEEQGLRTTLKREWDDALGVSRLRIEPLTSIEELVDHVGGMAGLKDELSKLGLKCGGTLQERAERLWKTRGVDNIAELIREHPELGVQVGKDKKRKMDESVKLVLEKQEKRERRQQGPLMEGLEWKPGQKKLPTIDKLVKQHQPSKSKYKQMGGPLSGPGPEF